MIQNRFWKVDRLQKRGWPNCGNFPLCNQVQESMAHLLYKCSSLKRILKEILSLCGINDDQMDILENEDSVEDWWTKVDLEQVKERKAMKSIVMTISWKIW
jgi:hypothetical protein